MLRIEQTQLDAFISSTLFEQIAYSGHLDEEITDFTQLTHTGVKCFSLFLQENSTGPSIGLKEDEYKDLSMEGEDMIPGLKGVNFLKVAKLSFEVRNKQIAAGQEPNLENVLWNSRMNYFMQSLYSEPINILSQTCLNGYEKLIGMLEESELSDIDKAFICVESSYAFTYYHKYEKADEVLEKARIYTGLEYKLTGQLGARMKSQTKLFPQLVLQTVSKILEDQEIASSTDQSVKIDDEFGLLEKPHLVDDNSAPISGIDQCILLALCNLLFKSRPHEELQQEEIGSYLTKILERSVNWLVYSKGLMMRSFNEVTSYKRRERSVLQVQVLVDQYRDIQPNAEHRLRYFFATSYPVKYWLNKELAEMYMKLGAVMSAYNLYTTVGQFEDAAECLLMAGQTNKAEELARQKLAEKETARLYCLLGDITQDNTYYQTAWDKFKSTRALRTLGRLAFKNNQWDSCIEYFNRALGINPMFMSAWFMLGCAYMKKDFHQEAANSFQRVVQLDDSQGDAWNNLAACYISLSKLDEAGKALELSLKTDRQNWRVWENLLTISLTTQNISKVFESINNLIILRQTESLQPRVFGYLNKYCIESERVPSLLRLYDELTSKITVSGAIWEHYADLCASCMNSYEITIEKVIDLRIKECRAFMKINWHKDDKICEEVIPHLIKLANSYALCEAEAKKYEGRMFIQNSLAKIAMTLQREIDIPKF